jgi:hypothetical protein
MNFNKSFTTRFWGKVSKTKTCWLWQGAKDRDGYGQIRPNSVVSVVKAHRASFYLFHGQIDEDKFVCHSCDVPSCVNPSHLFLGSNKDNVKDMDTKGRRNPAKNNQLPQTRLTPEKVREIRKLYKETSCTYKKLAVQFEVSQSAIFLIVKKKNWKYIA